MKTGKAILAVVFAGMTAGTALATGNLTVNMAPVNRDMAVVEISNAKASRYEIKVTDEKGELVFFKETKTPAMDYKRNYDFSLLDDGNYWLTVKVDNEKTETHFSMERGDITVLGESKSVEPTFLFDGKHLKLSYLNFAGSDVDLYVYDDSRTTLYEKNLSKGFAIHHGLDFTKLGKGEYEVVLASDGGLYSYSVSID